MRAALVLLILSFQMPPVPEGDSQKNTLELPSKETDNEPAPLHVPERRRESISIREETLTPQERSFASPPVESSTSWEAAFSPENWATWSLTGSVLAAAIAGIWTAMLLGRQIRVASQPRLYIDTVRFTGLVAGSKPVFFANIGNTGPTDAHNVTVTINATYGTGGGSEGAPQTRTIPAYSSREFFVRWPAALTSDVRNDIEAGTCRLSVTITAQHGDGEPLKYAYQYHTWDNDRPPGVPDFVPSDPNSQLVKN